MDAINRCSRMRGEEMAHNVSKDKYIELVLCKREKERWRGRKGRERERKIGRERKREEGERDKGGER